MEPKRVSYSLGITLDTIALIIIAIFVILAYFNGWG